MREEQGASEGAAESMKVRTVVDEAGRESGGT